MTPKERARLQRLDELVLHASPKELARIREADFESQLGGLPFHDVYRGPGRLVRRGAGAAD